MPLRPAVRATGRSTGRLSGHFPGHATGHLAAHLTGRAPGQFRPPARTSRAVDLTFGAGGTRYARVWLINLLLTVLSLGLAWPLARTRRMRWLVGHTVVDNHGLEFHGRPWALARVGWTVLALTATGAAGAWYAPAPAGVAALLLSALLLMLLQPALWWAALRWRIGNTRWRGVQFHFSATLTEAYQAWWPLWPPTLLLLAGVGGLFTTQFGGTGGHAALRLSAWTAVAVALVAGLALLPTVAARVVRTRQGNYRFAGETSWNESNAADFSRLCWRSVGLAAAGAAALALAAALGGSGWAGHQRGNASGLWAIAFAAPWALAGAVLLVVAWAYASAGMFNLAWGQTRSSGLRIRSHLRWQHTASLALQHGLLLALTGGLYWPFARMSALRQRLHALAIDSKVDPQLWIAQTRAAVTESGVRS